MNTIFVIHGSCGSPEENWFPWLKQELEKLGHHVIIPCFPTPENQSLIAWRKVFSEYGRRADGAIFIGHSLGPAFILDILEKHKLKAAFFVSGFIGVWSNHDFNKINDTFVNRSFDWKKIKSNCSKFYIYHSDNDPYVPLSIAQGLAKKLDTKVIIVKGAGHFNKADGYDKFEQLLKEIKEILI